MKHLLALLPLSLGLIALTPANLPLEPFEISQLAASTGYDERLLTDKKNLLQAIDHSLRYLNSSAAIRAYQNYPIPEITRQRVQRSLVRFRQLVQNSPTPAALQKAVKQEFIWYRSLGNDSQGNVKFTGYFEPIYQASRQKNSEYKYPLYRRPANFSRWSKPHPARVELEGKDGLLGENSRLAGYELVWLKDRLEAYLVHVQGSAKLRLPNGQIMSIGFDGNTEHPYTSLGKEMIADGIFPAEGLTLPMVLDFLRNNPEQLKNYIPRNNRFIFFRETHGAPPTGSIGVPVLPERSIATDKSIFPPGALAVIETEIPQENLNKKLVSRYVLDQDTGSAIKGTGRVDIFMGTGKNAGERAGLVNTPGQLYYLLLRQE